MKKEKSSYILAGVSFALFILLIILLRTVDVQSIGPEGTAVGLATVNGAFQNLFGFNKLWYVITKALGGVAILTAFAFALLFIWQTAGRKDIKKTDRELVNLMALYAIWVCLYVFFDKVIVNYRPIIMAGDEHVEASFPSTHTILGCVIMGSAMMILGKYIKNETLKKVLLIACAAVIAVTVIGRLISGVHWLTDIIGGVILSACLLFMYKGSIETSR